MGHQQSLRVDVRDGIALVTIDAPHESVNTLGLGLRDEFTDFLYRLERDASIHGAVLASGKPDVWIAGADVEELAAAPGAAEAAQLSRNGHLLLDRLERGKPVVAAIDGACLGGGLEVALACAYRIAAGSAKTVLALPEVKLGLIPGAGGTQRLPRLVGLAAALDMILTGKDVRAKKAYQLGVVDELVHPAILIPVALRRARELADGTLRRARRAGTTGARARELFLDDNPLGRRVVLNRARDTVLRKTGGHYPAPLAALDAVAAGFHGERESGYETESRLFGELAVTDVSRQLVHLFFATAALKKETGADDHAARARPVAKLGVLGAGFMGAGIAAVAAQAGTVVRLRDADHARVGAGLRAVRATLGERLRKRQITRQQLDDQLSLVSGTTDYTGFARVDLVVEAVFEELAVKRQVLAEVEAVAPPDAVLATNTSTIPIARIAEASARPERVVGMHFFSPVPKMPLLEVVRGERTGAEAVATAVAYGRRLGKTVIVVGDGPGFYVNRILAPYLNEAGHLLDEGVAVDAIDAALVEFGFPVGPLTLMDEVGIDVAGRAGAVLAAAFPARMAPSEALKRVIEAGRQGRKNGQGFYQYDTAGKRGEVDATVYAHVLRGLHRQPLPRPDIQQRLVYAMLNEAARALDDGVVRSPRDGDVGAVFGIGFPPFRGGPFRHADSLGAAAVVRALEELERRFGARYAPAPSLETMASRGGRFYPG
ncbi:MAG: Enoyl-CoA hydratase / Delta(3)-cis-delta(2)-trans-enoyl-CoA isomerase / 3-hydroxyacyl-CoA dehydrogenase / 3-hydroxybutyryl-CoA epimerase [uncultured Gemmatimonadaceae bacterium]|uniref:enoyl-CoA hydratase n=1 Tax=uncultured Gemmatimonadaceae bacterium TaxID=246130 RepID=A0A6J4LFH9_9BACT|nr:MAG: Enoyl-CoA hydratase / Delta(3)-cis-delta(2)-trans-enoyl-CoA isomerase / 3-hydroxyacyl-CoA dehydrogenase / 3-hydroxybutyryl-CoA epimerase [uncultured Gemmatimonadaceae bacterium]